MARPKQFDPDQAVETAMDLFWTRGYHGATPAGIVAALGLGKGSVYNAFGSKGGLFEAALRRYGEMRIASLRRALDAPGSARQRLAATLHLLSAPERAHLRQRGCLAVNSVSDVEDRRDLVHEIVRNIFRRMQDALSAVVAEGQRSGELKDEKAPDEIAGALLAALLGMSVLGRLGTPGAQLKVIADALIAGL